MKRRTNDSKDCADGSDMDICALGVSDGTIRFFDYKNSAHLGECLLE